MRFDVLSIFPDMFTGPFAEGVVGRGLAAGLIDMHVHDLRDWAEGSRRNVDDATYGGGCGMVLKPEPVYAAVEAVRDASLRGAVVLLCPSGRRLSQARVAEFARLEQLILVCGRYEGVDERVREGLVDEVLSIGDYVLSGGEIPAMVVVDAVSRLVPGVVGKEESVEAESFAGGLLDYPHYTRPAEFRGRRVPEVLLSGDHERIRLWRKREALARTVRLRPELLDGAALDEEDQTLIKQILEDFSVRAPVDLAAGTLQGGSDA